MGQPIKAELVAAREGKLFYYSPYNYLRKLSVEKQQRLFGTGLAEQYAAVHLQRVFEFVHGNSVVQFLYAFLPWDTDFFKAKIYRLFTLLFAENTSVNTLTLAISAFWQHLKREGAAYCFGEVPAEDTRVAQALGSAGWRLVETRLTYFHDKLDTFDQPRYQVRSAEFEEAAAIGHISATARNEYDRFHADSWYAGGLADHFLARYASAAVEGYCDEVLVPNVPGMPVDSFLAVSDLKQDSLSLGVGLSRVVLAAVGAANRGWHLKLVSETVQRARQNGANYVLMTTQATNRAVLQTCEKLNFELGNCTHVFAYSVSD